MNNAKERMDIFFDKMPHQLLLVLMNIEKGILALEKGVEQ